MQTGIKIRQLQLKGYPITKARRANDEPGIKSGKSPVHGDFTYEKV